jgi:hypothetical protein
MPISFEERLLRLEEIREYLIDERNFAMSCKDWPRVSIFKQKLKLHAEQVAVVKYRQLTAA